MGHAVMFAGPLKHAGYPITQGTRMILVLFLYIEDFHYGPYLTAAKAHCRGALCGAEAENETENTSQSESFIPTTAAATVATTSSGTDEKKAESGTAELQVLQSGCREDGKLHSGGEKGGFVVYRQTVDLVNMLEKPSVISDE